MVSYIPIKHFLTAEPVKKGLSRAELRALLLKSGWQPSAVNSYLKKVFRNLEPHVILRVESVSKSFNKSSVLDNVDFDVRSGEIFGIIGMSGAGKTTLLNLIVGFYSPDAGDVLFALPDGSTASITRNPCDFKRFFGFSTQTPSFYSRLTVRENLEYFASLYHIPEPRRSKRCADLLSLVGLKDFAGSVADELSGGMQKRLDIACALIHKPRVLILDEPTADLDPVLRKNFWELVRKINMNGTTIIIASHFLQEIESLCSRIAVLHNHRIVDVGSVDDLKNVYSRNFEVRLKTKSGKYVKLMKFLSKHKNLFSKIFVDEGELVVSVFRPINVLSLILGFVKKHSEVVVSLDVSRPSLGDVFEVLVKK
ncbi:hypothetical protein DRJ22_00305 [Candidatus Woesearchaeota archaeon]|nr:MAG: hypothetical protein DRJ22_00305 [Candidatus Woesearchaeota archaeon]